jgi:hypothetical protein
VARVGVSQQSCSNAFLQAASGATAAPTAWAALHSTAKGSVARLRNRQAAQSADSARLMPEPRGSADSAAGSVHLRPPRLATKR